MAKKTLASLEKQLNEMQEYAEDLELRLNEIFELSRPAEDEEEGDGVVVVEIGKGPEEVKREVKDEDTTRSTDKG